MQEKPKVVVSRTRRTESTAKEFNFAESDIRAAGDQRSDPVGSVASYRALAWSAFKKHSLPVTTEEAWRRTDIHNLPVEKFKFAAEGAFNDLPPVREDLLKPLAANQHGGQIILTPGGVKVELDEKLAKKGVIFTDLKTAEQKHPELLARMIGKIVNVEEGKFSALAGAFAQNGVVLYVPKGLIVEEPLHSVLWGPGADIAHVSHILVLVDEGASVTYVHESASPDETGTNSMHAGIVEIQVLQNASMKFVELQSWGRHVWNFSHERARVERSGNLDWIFGAIGSRLTKNFTELDLAGEGAQGRMSGFYFTDGNQHLDHDTQQNHLAPHTTSDLLFKGALKGKSRSVWQGMIYVAPGAQKTDGYQANRNLVLSDGARADSIPGLEILADDVRCTHGATVGKLEQEPLFYLKSRGIPQVEAEKLVVEGFFDPIFQRIPFEGVRERFQQYIADKMA
jgi:Fe-S cluster assembly protein SufD